MNPNEPAFPQSAVVGNSGNIEHAANYTSQAGLTVRAYIATQVAGHLSSALPLGIHYSDKAGGHVAIAKDAVSIADALIAELNR